VKFFAEVLADGTIGLCILRKGGESSIDFFAKLFWIKKRVFGYFFQKVTLLINLPYLFLEKFSLAKISI